MDTVAIIAEYNPFHLGHVKHISYVKNVLKAKNVIVVMSGNFTQRGEPAVMDKFTRAKHAVLAGADMVVELPTVFATANAEMFAKGAVKIIESLGVVDGVCFGVESGEKDDYIKLAAALNDESKEFKKILKEQLEKGIYVLYSAEKNGTKRSFVRLVQVETGTENDGYLEIISGINYGEKIVTSSTAELYDGAEVVVV